MLGIKQPDAKLFVCMTEHKVSHRNIPVPAYSEDLEGVITLLSKAAPLTDLYFYLRDHPLQNPAKTKVHCEHGFTSLRLAVKVYLEVSSYRIPFLTHVLISSSRNVHISFPKFFEGNQFYVILRDFILTMYIHKVGKLSSLSSLCRSPAQYKGDTVTSNSPP
jgi:hypothetical protein